MSYIFFFKIIKNYILQFLNMKLITNCLLYKDICYIELYLNISKIPQN